MVKVAVDWLPLSKRERERGREREREGEGEFGFRAAQKTAGYASRPGSRKTHLTAQQWLKFPTLLACVPG